MMASLAILYRPYFPPAVIGLVVVSALALAVWAWRRTRSGHPTMATVALVMRAVVIAVIGGLLMGPSVLPEQSEVPSRGTVHFLVDASGSMQTRDIDGGSRYGFVLERWLNPDRLAQLQREYDVRLYSFGDRVRATLPDEGDATQRVSNVAESAYDLIGTMGSDTPDANRDVTLVVLSDGRDTRGASVLPAAKLAQSRGVQVHGVTLGGVSMTRDLSLTAAPRQPYLMVNEPGQIDVRIHHTQAVGMASTLHIQASDGRVSHQPLTFTAEQPNVRVEVPIRHDKPGLYTYDLTLDPLPGEPEQTNNHQTVFVEVTGERMRVLVLEGQPYWDTKFLAQALRKDDRIELTQITQINRDRQERIVTRVDEPAMPPDNLEQLARYDVIILGRSIENVLPLSAARDLARYVSERGGRVILARGRPYETDTRLGRGFGEAMAAIEPVVWGRGTLNGQGIDLTESGRAHAVFARLMQGTHQAPTARDLPVLAGLRQVQEAKPATRVLATLSDGSTPAVVSMPYGRGMVTGVLGEGLWRWRLAASDNAALDGVFDAFWSDQVRWLVLGGDVGPGTDVSLRLSSRSIALEDELGIAVVLRGEAAAAKPMVTVIDPDGQATGINLSDQQSADARYRGAFVPTKPGIYTVRVAPPFDTNAPFEPRQTKFTAYDSNTERLVTAADPSTLDTLSRETGGQTFNPDDPDALLQVLQRQRAARLVPPIPEFIWDQGWLMAGLLVWAGAEWLLRKKGGLL